MNRNQVIVGIVLGAVISVAWYREQGLVENAGR